MSRSSIMALFLMLQMGILLHVGGAWSYGEEGGGRGAGVAPPGRDRPTPVEIGMFVHEVTDVDAINNRFLFRGLASMEWHDPRLAFDPELAGTDREFHVGEQVNRRLSQIWSPVPVVTNQVDTPKTIRKTLSIHSDGRVRFQGIYIVTVSANMDLRRFPFDRQTLEVHLESFAWNAGEMVFRAQEGALAFGEEFSNPEWRVAGVDASLRQVERQGEAEPFSRFVLGIEMERRYGFYLWKVALPLLLIVAMSWAVFWMPEEGLAPRIRISFTGVLTIVAYQFVVAGSLPRIPYLTLMDAATTFSFLIVALTMVENLLVSHFGRVKKELAYRLDRRSRIIFPLAYFGMLALVITLY